MLLPRWRFRALLAISVTSKGNGLEGFEQGINTSQLWLFPDQVDVPGRLARARSPGVARSIWTVT
jgi:hypothetical protein